LSLSMRLIYKALYLPFLVFISCAGPAHVSKVETNTYSLNNSGPVDSASIRIIRPYKAKHDAIMNEVLNVSDQPMEKGQPEGVLGDFVCDLSLIQTRAVYKSADNKTVDFCFMNNGGLRSTLPKGDILLGKVFELMPFENQFVVVDLDGPSTKKIIDFIAEKGGVPVSGIKMGIRDKKAINPMIGNQPFDINRRYKIVTSDYLANGGDNLSFMAESKTKVTLDLKIRDAIINYLKDEKKKGNRLIVKKDGRIYNE
jgi:2',3'-cyclic-nucleotide 2'-phosphodiesterase (5'-nucleotidase family)